MEFKKDKKKTFNSKWLATKTKNDENDNSIYFVLMVCVIIVQQSCTIKIYFGFVSVKEKTNFPVKMDMLENEGLAKDKKSLWFKACSQIESSLIMYHNFSLRRMKRVDAAKICFRLMNAEYTIRRE